MSYIPSKDADVITWGNNFATLLTADPSLYGIDASLALINQTMYDEFVAAFNLASDPATRTIVTVAQKDEEKAGFLSLARSIAAIIRADQGVSEANKAALGLTIPDPTPTPIPAPTTKPVLSAPLAGQNQVYMTIVDELTPDKKSKPAGVAGCVIFRAEGTAFPLSFADAKFNGIRTRSDNIMDTSDVAGGTLLTYWAQWFNAKGELGPVSSGANTTAVAT